MSRSVLGICVVVGSTIGGVLPTLWGAGAFSGTALLLSVVGAIGGVWAAAKLSA